MKGFKRLVTILLSTAMVVGSCFNVMAADAGSIESEEGKLEGYVNKKIFSVNVPTNDASALAMVLDPQELIKDTNAAAYRGLTKDNFEDGATVFFPRKSYRDSGDVARTVSYASASDTISAPNVGSVSADVTFTAEVTAADGITFVSQNTALSGNTPSILIKFVDEATSGRIDDVALMKDANSKITGSVTTSVNAIPADKFSASYNGAEYSYKLTEATSANAIRDASKAAFHLKAEANKEADWSNLKTIAPKIKLTWKFAAKSDGSGYAMTKNNENGNLYYQFTTGAPSGTLTAVTVNGTSRPGAITSGNILYNVTAGRFIVQNASVTNLGLTQGNTTIVATIGGQEYTFTY